jgi:hypothetical protein
MSLARCEGHGRDCVPKWPCMTVDAVSVQQGLIIVGGHRVAMVAVALVSGRLDAFNMGRWDGCIRKITSVEGRGN